MTRAIVGVAALGLVVGAAGVVYLEHLDAWGSLLAGGAIPLILVRLRSFLDARAIGEVAGVIADALDEDLARSCAECGARQPAGLVVHARDCPTLSAE